MRKFRLIILLTAVLCAALLVTSCSCNGDGNNPDDTTATTDPVDDSVTVTFDYRDGRAPVSSVMKIGDSVSEPEAPVRSGYDFAGWFTDEALSKAATFGEVKASVTYYAAWTPHEFFLVRFDSLGGSAVASLAAEKGKTVSTPEAPTREGYTFTGWFTDEACTKSFDFSTAIVENMTLYAGWKTAEGYTEVVGYIDGKAVKVISVKKGENLEELSLDDGYLYCWFSDEAMTKMYTFPSAVHDDLNLYGFAYSEGLVIKNGSLVSYNGNAKNVIVPEKWEGVSVTSIGESAFAGNKTLLTVQLPDTVTTVGAAAFSGCEKLVSVNLGNACKSLGEYAFSGCRRLSDLGKVDSLTEIADGTFLGCESLRSVTLSDELTSVGESAFSGCKALETLNISDGVTSIGDYAFSDCGSLKSFRVPSKLKSFGTGVLTECSPTLIIDGGNDIYRVIEGNLYGDAGKTLLRYIPGENAPTTLSLPGSVSKIAAYAFYGDSNLTVVNLSGYTLEAGALAGMKSLRELALDTLSESNPYLAYYFGATNGAANGSTGIFVPKTLEKVTFKTEQTSVADYAFYGCTGLKNIGGISKARTIGSYAFAYTAIETLTLPADVQNIGEGAFNRCEYLAEFKISGSNAAYSVYDGCLYNKALTELLIVPRTKTTVAFPESVKVIASGAFFKSNVKEITVPSSVTMIEASAFAEATALESLTVPFIGGSADENCYMLYIFGGSIIETEEDGEKTYRVSNSGAAPSSLKKLTVTGKLSAIPDFAFAYLENVSELNFYGDVTSIGMYGFYGTGLVEVVIPSTVKKVGDYAYADMDELESVTVPGSVGDGLGVGVFFKNQSLKTVRFEEGVTVIPNLACYPFTSVDRTGKTVYSSAIEEIYLPSTLVRIGDSAFAFAGTYSSGPDNTRFDDEFKFVMVNGDSLVEIGDRAFYMSAITELKLSSALRSVGELCFAACGKLSSVTFGSAEKGSALELLGGACFAGCTGLNELKIFKKVSSAADVPALGEYKPSEDEASQNIFEGTEVPSIYVIGSSFYRKTAGWDNYDKQIYEINN